MHTKTFGRLSFSASKRVLSANRAFINGEENINRFQYVTPIKRIIRDLIFDLHFEVLYRYIGIQRFVCIEKSGHLNAFVIEMFRRNSLYVGSISGVHFTQSFLIFFQFDSLYRDSEICVHRNLDI